MKHVLKCLNVFFLKCIINITILFYSVRKINLSFKKFRPLTVVVRLYLLATNLTIIVNSELISVYRDLM